MLSNNIIALVVALSHIVTSILALGINCRGSALCPRAGWNNDAGVSIVQLLRDVVWASLKSNSTIYNSGDHIICVSHNPSQSPLVLV